MVYPLLLSFTYASESIVKPNVKIREKKSLVKRKFTLLKGGKIYSIRKCDKQFTLVIQ